MTACNACGGETKEVFSFGDVYISNFIPLDHKSSDYPKSNLTMMVCTACGAGQLKKTINPDVLYKDKYWYYSGINQMMKDYLEDVVTACSQSVKSVEGDIWLDIASNDGTLLGFVPDHFDTIGIDPADEGIMSRARQKADHIVNDYFSETAFRSVFPFANAKVITCIAMFYDLEDPEPFLKDVHNCLRDDGIFVVQVSYTPLMLKQLEFGNICAEHVMYYDFVSLATVLGLHNFDILDCDFNDVNGGSIRLYCSKAGHVEHFRSPQKRDVAKVKINNAFYGECHSTELRDLSDRCIDLFTNYVEFYNKIYQLKIQTVDFINGEIAKGKTVYGYGASTKGNTLLQYFGLDSSTIKKIADRNSAKWGLKTIGSEIPICSEEEMRRDNPDYLLILPWHFIEEFKDREHAYLKGGGKFIVPSPRFEIIEA